MRGQRDKDKLEKIIRYRNKYGKRNNSEPKKQWILRRRTLNSACNVLVSINTSKFEEFELAIFVGTKSPKIRKFLRVYEMQMETAFLNEEKFITGLHDFYCRMAEQISRENLYLDFYEFLHIMVETREKKRRLGFQNIFDAYVSLLIQQSVYFLRFYDECDVIGIRTDGSLMMRRSPYPYSDVGSYELEALIKNAQDMNEVTEKKVSSIYHSYGYKVSSLEELERLELEVRVYENNIAELICFIDEYREGIVINTPYQSKQPFFPRVWRDTSVYELQLKRRNYMLPSTGITANYENAGDIKSIFFQEVHRDDRVILLYKVITFENGEYAGYYDTKNDYFYSIYNLSGRNEWHENIKNFILENYMILTCEYHMDRKRNFAIRQVEDLKEFHYPQQPLVQFIYYDKKKGNRSKESVRQRKHYNKAEYQEEVSRRLEGYFRKLPDGQQASDEARQNALNLGYELPDGKTFVREHEKMIYRNVYFETPNKSK